MSRVKNENKSPLNESQTLKKMNFNDVFILGCYLDNIMVARPTNYRTHAIISRGLYIFYPFFSAVYNQEQLILQTIYVVNKEMWA